MGWIVYAFHIFFERHLIQVRRMFLKKELYLSTKIGNTKENDGSLHTPLETTYLNSIVVNNNVDNQALPQWSDIDIDEYHQNRSWLARALAGRGETNRQHAIYWLDRRGPWVYLHILQANLLFLGVYAAMNFLSFFQHMYHTSTSLLVFCTYVILAGFPFLSILLTKQHTVAVLSQVCCMGAHRRPNVVDRVLREDKTARAVGTFLILMRASSGGKSRTTSTRSTGRGQQQHEQQGGNPAGVRSLSEAERREVAKAFDTLDHEGRGTIAREEFERLMRNLGSGVSDEGLSQLAKRLDEDGSGGVSKEEFIQWYAESAVDDDLSEMERAHLLFGIFDSDNTGDITIAEFKDKLDSLNVGFTVDEIGAIVNELDEDNSGTISQHEFAHLLHKYHPKALQSLR
jgi:Ca2+-binding EF-hand superfamily protein